MLSAKMYSLKDKIREQAEAEAMATAEVKEVKKASGRVIKSKTKKTK